MNLQYETLDDVPEDLKESFVEFKEGDKTLFLHKDLADTKREFYRTKGDLTQAQRKQQEALERLQALEDAENKRQRELEEKDLESKQKNGQYEEILNDFKTKAQQREEELKRQLDELNSNVRNEKKSAVVSELSSLGTEHTRDALKRLIALDLDFGDDGSLIVMENGKASSTTIAEYKAKLKDLYPSLVGESHGKGGQGKGGNGSLTQKSNTNVKADEAKKRGDLKGFLDASIKLN